MDEEVIPLPRPLMTPPVTITYFMMVIGCSNMLKHRCGVDNPTLGELLYMLSSMYCSWRREDSTMIDTRQCFRLIIYETSAAKPNTQASPKAMRKRDVRLCTQVQGLVAANWTSRVHL